MMTYLESGKKRTLHTKYTIGILKGGSCGRIMWAASLGERDILGMGQGRGTHRTRAGKDRCWKFTENESGPMEGKAKEIFQELVAQSEKMEKKQNRTILFGNGIIIGELLKSVDWWGQELHCNC